MGCDIHIAVEENTPHGWLPVRLMYSFHRKIWDADKNGLDGFSSPAVCERHYTFFAALAGVRGHGPKARGWPDDINPATRYFLERHGGDHTPSWYPLAEFCKIWRDIESPADEFTQKYPATHLFMIDSADENAGRFRVLFNFDS